MAITMITEPLGLYPAYNNSYIEFNSDLVDNFKAEVIITALSGEIFTVFPEVGGNYLLDLKDIVKSLINVGGFRNQDTSYPIGWTEAYPFGYLSLDITLKTYNTLTNDSLAKTYTFIRGAKQIEETIYANPYQLLHNSINGVDYNLTYFEGFPFSFEISRVTAAEDLQYKNLNTSDITVAFAAVTTNTQRVWIDKATENWTTEAYLPLTDTLNRLEIHVDTVAETNLNIKKVPSKCGVYLRWFNRNGGYSYFLFDEFYKSNIKTRNRGNVGSNIFNNVGSHVAPFVSVGKTARESYKLRAIVDQLEAEHLRDLVSSPAVELYNSFEPFIAANFIDVQVNTGYVFANKKALNEVIISIELPELITPTL